MINLLRALAMAGVTLAVAAPAAAHHSFAMFDRTKDVTLEGTVKEFQYTNPHAWLVVTVPAGQPNAGDWMLELAAVSALQRQGILKSSFPAGERVTARMHPMKDGRKAGEFLSAVKANGVQIGAPMGLPPPVGARPPA